jgi:hypothetical protein
MVSLGDAIGTRLAVLATLMRPVLSRGFRRPDLNQQLDNQTARSISGLFPGKGRTWASLPRSGFQMSWSADSAEGDPMILSTHQRPSQGDAAPPGGLSTRWIESAVECCNVTADAAGGIGARLALRKAENPKKGECRPLYLIPPHIGRRNGSKRWRPGSRNLDSRTRGPRFSATPGSVELAVP